MCIIYKYAIKTFIIIIIIIIDRYSFYGEKLINLMKNSGLYQKVKDFTRITEESKTIIDVIFTDDENVNV